MIRLDNVCKHYRKGAAVVRALEAVSLEVPNGAFALLTGPSGSGKTTLINVVAGLTRPTSGAVEIAGRRLDEISAGQRAMLRAKQVAVVFQMFHLVPYLTALENVLLPTLAGPGPDGKAAKSRAQQILDELGLGHRLTHYPDELSVGERQRCAMARALLNEPQIVLADEPTGNLDPDSAHKVMSALQTCHARGATILLASHQPLEDLHPDVQFKLLDGQLQDVLASARQ